MEKTLTQRQRRLLEAVVEAHTTTCAPVSSQSIADRSGLTVSPATIRNDMADLEGAGMLTHPHTSAGRVPTVAGYRYYVDHRLGTYRLTSLERNALQAAPTGEGRQRVKGLAKRLAELSSTCVVVGFSAHDVYYTGLSNLFAQPEFRDYRFSFLMSEVIDRLDEVMADLYGELAAVGDVQVLVGDDHHFGERCSTLLGRFRQASADSGVLGLLGPLRMNYPRNLALLDCARQTMAG